MNYAVVIAGGKGTRSGYVVPKQFLTVNDIPIIIYTLQNITKLTCIEKVVVVVPDGWQGFMQSYAKQFDIDKLIDVAIGGNTRIESVFNGIKSLQQTGFVNDSPDCLIGFYDGNRPLIPEIVTLEAINAARKYGSAVALEPCYDTMLECKGDLFIDAVKDRSVLYKGQCPEFVQFSILNELMASARNQAFADLPLYALLLQLGRKVSYVKGSSKGFKITTAEDVELFKAMIRQKP